MRLKVAVSEAAQPSIALVPHLRVTPDVSIRGPEAVANG